MRVLPMALLLLASTCLHADQSLIPALSDDLVVADGSELLVGYVSTYVTLKDSQGRELSVLYRTGDSHVEYHDQFAISAGGQKTPTVLSRGSEDEKALVRLILRAYSNTFGARGETDLGNPISPSVDGKRHAVLHILRALERRKHPTK